MLRELSRRKAHQKKGPQYLGFFWGLLSRRSGEFGDRGGEGAVSTNRRGSSDRAESELSPTAQSSVQAIGLGEVRWSVWGSALIKAGICKEARDLYDIPTNIRAANYILLHEIKATSGNFIQALERYVGGKQKSYVDRVAYNHLHLAMIKK
jgi:hypothetical protein